MSLRIDRYNAAFFLLTLLMFCLMSAVGRTADPADALDAANAERAARGLPPFQRDDGLTEAAKACAYTRAMYGIQGHLASDFAALPAGVHADAAGCAAWPAGMGFGACALFENWPYAGASTYVGTNGLHYHHLFVSRTHSTFQVSATPPAPATKPAPMLAAPAATCPAGGCATVRTTTTVREQVTVSDDDHPLMSAMADLTQRVAWRLTHPFGGRFRR